MGCSFIKTAKTIQMTILRAYAMTSLAVVMAMSGRNKRRRDKCISKNTGVTLLAARMTV